VPAPARFWTRVAALVPPKTADECLERWDALPPSLPPSLSISLCHSPHHCRYIDVTAKTVVFFAKR
jgi:hypothetical protein